MARDLEQIKQLSQKKETKTAPEPIKRPLPESTAKGGTALYPPKKPVQTPPKQISEPRVSQPARPAGKPTRPIPPPIRRPRAEPEKIEEKKPEIRLSDILKGARKRIEEGPKKTPALPAQFDHEIKPAAVPQKTHEDILPIEPSTPSLKSTPPAQSPASPAGRPEGNEAGPPQSKGLGGEPPPNLPTSEPARFAPSMEQIKEIREPQGKPLDVTPSKTPEEILGLPARPTDGPVRPGIAKKPPEETKLPKPPVPIPSKPAPEKIAKEDTALRLPKKDRLPTLKFVAIAGVLAIVLVAMLGGLYWNFFIKKPPEQTKEPSKQISEPPESTPLIEQPKPLALLQHDYEHIIEIDELNYEVLKTNITALQDVSFPAESVIYIPIKYVAEDEIRYITPKELFDMLEINIPAGIFDYGEATLFLYIQSTEAQEICTSAGITSGSCYGPRLGIAVEINQKETVLAAMSEWETTLVNDLNPLILAEYEIPEDSTFKMGSYKDFDAHYINLQTDEAASIVPTTSIDWILTDDYLIIATSKNSARKAVDKLIDSKIQVTISPTQGGKFLDWKTYSNDEFNFKFNYPSSWKIDDRPPLEGTSYEEPFIFSMTVMPEGRPLDRSGSISISSTPSMTFEDIIEQTKSAEQIGSVELTNFQEFNSVDFEGKKYQIIYHNEMELINYVYILKLENHKTIFVQFNSRRPDGKIYIVGQISSELLEMIDEFVSSFSSARR